MISKKNVIFLTAIAVGIIVGFYLFNKKAESLDYIAKVFETGNGYGYVIIRNNKILIKQEQIPAIQEVKSFCTYADALRTAELVKEKIIKNQNPGVTLQELELINIDLKCSDLP